MVSPLSKVVLHVWDDGSCSLLTVPLDWRPGQVVPDGAPEERYDTPSHAMSALAEAGRAQAPTMSWHRDPAKCMPADAAPESGEASAPPRK